MIPLRVALLTAFLSPLPNSSGRCHLLAAALSVTSSSPAPTARRAPAALDTDGAQQPPPPLPLPNSHSIFVGDLGRGCDVSALRDAFGKYGEIRDATVHGEVWKQEGDGEESSEKPAATKKRSSKVRPFAFVCFEDPDSAIRAVAEFREISEEAPAAASLRLFGTVEKAEPRKPRAQSLARRSRARERSGMIARFAEGASIVIQAPKSHLDRLEEYLPRCHDCEVLGRLDSGRRSVGLLFLKTETALEATVVAEELLSVPWASVAVNKLYVVEPGTAVRVQGGSSGTEAVAEEALRRLKALRSSAESKRRAGDGDGSESAGAVVRVQAFPPKFRPGLIAAVNSMWNDEDMAGVDIRPAGFTHTLSVVELEPLAKKEGKKEAGMEGTVYLMGLTEAMSTDAVATHDRARFVEQAETGNDDVCRAYYKIQEALTRYDATAKAPFGNRLVGSVALDCGASPGGWTKYLLEEAGCTAVHSVDPGELSPIVRALSGARHWKMRVEDALPLLAEENARVDVWTSDMCLHDMSEQIDWMLRAREVGVLSPNAMFVLTLKCLIGHSKLAYDNQVDKEVARLQGLATGVEVMHLFSNRSGERTVMGFLR